jgi:hypothetical protein
MQRVMEYSTRWRAPWVSALKHAQRSGAVEFSSSKITAFVAVLPCYKVKWLALVLVNRWVASTCPNIANETGA